MTKEMKCVLDAYFGPNKSVSGDYPIPYTGFVGRTRATVLRAEVEAKIESGQLDMSPAVIDSVEQLKTQGKITSRYFPWVIQRARELVANEQNGEQ